MKLLDEGGGGGRADEVVIGRKAAIPSVRPLNMRSPLDTSFLVVESSFILSSYFPKMEHSLFLFPFINLYVSDSD